MTPTRLVLRQTRLEQLAFWRNPDYAFFTFALPLALLLLLGTVNSSDTIPGRDLPAATFMVPGLLCFSVIVAAYANLAARIAVLRSEGVLKRVRTTPLPPGVYLAGQLISTLFTTLLVATTTVALGAVVFDTQPRPGGAATLAIGLCFGITCFAVLGLAISAAIPSAESASPITNASYLPLALISGVFDPTLELPSWLSRTVEAFPIRALVDTLQAAYDPAAQGLPIGDLAVLGVWATVGMFLALRYFRWQP